MNKKGLSPLVATLLLIAFSVALGTIVMNWGQGYIEDRAEFVHGANAAEFGCTGIDFQIVEVAGQKQICMQDSTVKVMVENLANHEIGALKARVTGSSDFRVLEDIAGGSLAPAATKNAELDVSGLGDLLQVKITPTVVVGETEQFCLHQAVVVEKPFRSC